jgi:hypothetical protein
LILSDKILHQQTPINQHAILSRPCGTRPKKQLEVMASAERPLVKVGANNPDGYLDIGPVRLELASTSSSIKTLGFLKRNPFLSHIC